jgi:hypothetical protein
MPSIFEVKYRTTVALINQYRTVPPTFNIYFLQVGPGRVIRPCAARTCLLGSVSNKTKRCAPPPPPHPSQLRHAALFIPCNSLHQYLIASRRDQCFIEKIRENQRQ